jgi:hypothetical protein
LFYIKKFLCHGCIGKSPYHQWFRKKTLCQSASKCKSLLIHHVTLVEFSRGMVHLTRLFGTSLHIWFVPCKKLRENLEIYDRANIFFGREEWGSCVRSIASTHQYYQLNICMRAWRRVQMQINSIVNILYIFHHFPWHISHSADLDFVAQMYNC